MLSSQMIRKNSMVSPFFLILLPLFSPKRNKALESRGQPREREPFCRFAFRFEKFKIRARIVNFLFAANFASGTPRKSQKNLKGKG
jgi:hypothetical protein